LIPELLRLHANEVKVGAPLPFGVRDEHGQLLLARGQIVAHAGQLEALLSRGLYVDGEEARAVKEGRAPDESPTRLTLFDLWGQAVGQLDRLLRSVDVEPGFPTRCDEFVARFMGLVQRDPDIGIYLSVRQDPRRFNLYGLAHALHTAMVCQLMAARLGWTPEAARSLVRAALTMNLAIIDVQARFAALGRLGASQRELIAAHPTKAVQMLEAAGVTDALWLQTVAQHHERPGGGGYPANLTEVGELAGVLRLADVFMAKISARVERPALPVQEAARQMFAESHGSQVAAAIIKEYGIYPPGNHVQLASGEQAVVIRRGATAHTPLVAAVTDRTGTPMVRTIRRDTAQAAYAIRTLVSDSSLVQRMPPERLYGPAD